LPPFWLTWTSTAVLSLFSCAADATERERAFPDDASPGAGLTALHARTGRRAAGLRRLAIANGAAAIALLSLVYSSLGTEMLRPENVRVFEIVGAVGC